jgi:hypothetical protein
VALGPAPFFQLVALKACQGAIANHFRLYEADGPLPDPPGYVPLPAWYVPSQDDANLYVLAGAEHELHRTADGVYADQAAAS